MVAQLPGLSQRADAGASAASSGTYGTDTGRSLRGPRSTARTRLRCQAIAGDLSAPTSNPSCLRAAFTALTWPQGIICRWDSAKGFGFIQGYSPNVVLHVRDYRGATLPAEGMRVEFREIQVGGEAARPAVRRWRSAAAPAPAAGLGGRCLPSWQLRRRTAPRPVITHRPAQARLMADVRLAGPVGLGSRAVLFPPGCWRHGGR